MRMSSHPAAQVDVPQRCTCCCRCFPTIDDPRPEPIACQEDRSQHHCQDDLKFKNKIVYTTMFTIIGIHSTSHHLYDHNTSDDVDIMLKDVAHVVLMLLQKSPIDSKRHCYDASHVNSSRVTHTSPSLFPTSTRLQWRSTMRAFSTVEHPFKSPITKSIQTKLLDGLTYGGPRHFKAMRN